MHQSESTKHTSYFPDIGTMIAKRRSRTTFCLALLTCMHLSQCSNAISTIRKIQKPEHPIGIEVDDDLHSRKTDAFRELKSGKNSKSSKSSKSNKSEKYTQSYIYYQDTPYSNDTPKNPASSPACKFATKNQKIERAVSVLSFSDLNPLLFLFVFSQ